MVWTSYLSTTWHDSCFVLDQQAQVSLYSYIMVWTSYLSTTWHDSCFVLDQQAQVSLYSYIMVWTSYLSTTWHDSCFVQDQQAQVSLYSSILLKQQSIMSNHVAHPDSDPTYICYYYLMLHNYQRRSKY